MALWPAQIFEFGFDLLHDGWQNTLGFGQRQTTGWQRWQAMAKRDTPAACGSLAMPYSLSRASTAVR